MPGEVSTESPALHDRAPMPSDNQLQSPASLADLRKAYAVGDNAPATTTEKSFGSLTITNEAQAKLCTALAKAPDGENTRLDQPDKTVAALDRDRVAPLAISITGDGATTTCAIKPDGTTISTSGDFRETSKKGDLPIAPDNVQILSQGGKVEFQLGADGKVVRTGTSHDGQTVTTKLNLNLAAEAVKLMAANTATVLWSDAEANKVDGPHFAIESSNDSTAMKAAITQWKEKYHFHRGD